MAALTRTPIDPAALTARVQAPSRGGVASFVGLVRDHHAGLAVARLEYSAYDAMAEAECARIVAEAEQRWTAGIALAHRVGMLEVGEAAICVAAAAAHRDAAFAACRFVVDEVKRRVPIWKREVYADGTDAWVDPTAVEGARPAAMHERQEAG